MISKKFFIFAAFALVCLGAAAREAAAAQPKHVNSCRTIDESGSYVLTKNLTADGDCITLAADNITLDLDGHTIRGDGGDGSGIWDGNPFDGTVVARRNITVRNGGVTNFNHGIILPGSSEVTVERMRVTRSNVLGIYVGPDSIIKDNTVTASGNHGIYAKEGSLVTGNVANNNFIGIEVRCGSNVIGNMARGNSFTDIVAGAGCARYNNNPAP